MNWKDMIGKTFNSLEVIRRPSKEETPWKSHSTPLLCKCHSCGKESILRKEDVEKGCVNCKILSGKITGGRGYQSLKAGQRFGKLTVIEYDKPHRTPSGVIVSYVKCQCDCGNKVSIRKEHLTGRKKGKLEGLSYTISCGCSQESAGELYIKNMLNEAGKVYKPQYIIPELSQWMKFDFAVFNETNELLCLIEYDGEQHFHPVALFGGVEKFNLQRERDERKNLYCKQQKIPLIRIPYTEKLVNLSLSDLLPSSRFEI
jgi:hypothetical protein